MELRLKFEVCFNTQIEHSTDMGLGLIAPTAFGNILPIVDTTLIPCADGPEPVPPPFGLPPKLWVLGQFQLYQLAEPQMHERRMSTERSLSSMFHDVTFGRRQPMYHSLWESTKRSLSVVRACSISIMFGLSVSQSDPNI